jgi:hypothetical protein
MREGRERRKEEGRGRRGGRKETFFTGRCLAPHCPWTERPFGAFCWIY